MNRINADKSKRFFKISLGMFIISLIVLIICIVFRTFAEFYSRTLSDLLRVVLSYLFSIFPFSFAEFLLLLLPAFLITQIIFTVYKRRSLKKLFRNYISVLFVLFFLFVNTFGVCYFRYPLEVNIGFDMYTPSFDELVECANFLKNRLETSTDSIEFSSDYSSVNPHDWSELCKLVDEGYNKLLSKYSFVSDINVNAKRIALSPIMTYTHISGIYIPFTSEANVNTNYPAYVVVYSLAHEKAHQRGIASEDEANFVAFLACMFSENEYLEYSALMSMYEYFLDEIYKSDSAAYYNLIEATDKKIVGEMYAYSVFFDKYRNSTASKVADTVNDTYIKAMGDDRGVESYSRVVELCVSYLKKFSLP